MQTLRWRHTLAITGSVAISHSHGAKNDFSHFATSRTKIVEFVMQPWLST